MPGRPPLGGCLALGMCLLLQSAPELEAAHAASNHELLVQHAWHKFEERGDWSDWEETWKLVDQDGDNKIKVGHGELTALFKTHYNILHEKLGHDERPMLFRANEQTFRREANSFLDHREKLIGSKHRDDPMTWFEFHEEMTSFMRMMKDKRGLLLDKNSNPILQVHKEL